MTERVDRELISEIDALWADQLEAIPAECIPRGVAPDVAEFLTTVGLPTAEVQGIAFVHDKRMSYLIEHLDRGYLLLATTVGLPSIVADLGDGRVGVFAGGRNRRLRFVNSSLPQFLLAQGVWRRDVWTPTGMTSQDLLVAYKRFEVFLADRDPAAAEASAYWPGLLTRLHDGLEL